MLLKKLVVIGLLTISALGAQDIVKVENEDKLALSTIWGEQLQLQGIAKDLELEIARSNIGRQLDAANRQAETKNQERLKLLDDLYKKYKVDRKEYSFDKNLDLRQKESKDGTEDNRK